MPKPYITTLLAMAKATAAPPSMNKCIVIAFTGDAEFRRAGPEVRRAVSDFFADGRARRFLISRMLAVDISMMSVDTELRHRRRK